ncbi:MAG: D-alanine--D-alanine ligase A, partial [Phototrophicales bacterium]
LHGPYGEDGTVQGFFDLMNLAYVGPDVTGSAVGMDKILSKRLVQGLGIAVSPWVDTDRECFAQNPQDFIKLCLEKLTFPMFVKPNRQGSSVGVTCVENLEDLNAACLEAFNYDERILV